MSESAVSDILSYALAVDEDASNRNRYTHPSGRVLTPYEVLRRTTPIAAMRDQGTFFTSSGLADELWDSELETLNDESIIIDPTCGAGDLLMPAAAYAVDNDLRNIVVKGSDIDAALSLITAARLRSTVGEHRSRAATHDFLANPMSVGDATHVALNPPFFAMHVDEDWAKGRVNAAAVFTLKALESMQPGSRLLAVLPDVLRSGARYQRWRDTIASLGAVTRVQVTGQFDALTDVHVFLMSVIVGEANDHAIGWQPTALGARTVGDFFDVRVGPVVPHRDPEEGPDVEFLTARSLTAGSVLRRRFSGRLDRGPMVLINRTSRPGQVDRVRARLRSSSAAIAVENHLLIAKPRSGGLASCRELMSVLAKPETARFLDDRIRCRHITVGAVKEIPWT